MTPRHPLAYLITFTTYGTRLHGDPRATIDGRCTDSELRQLAHDEELHAREESRLPGSRIVFDARHRQVCEGQSAEVCAHRRWDLFAANVRSNHVHAVVGAGAKPEKVMGDFKAWCTRRLREHRLVPPEGVIWSFHGSTRYLWAPAAVQAACRYVRFEQGTGTGIGLTADEIGWSPS